MIERIGVLGAGTMGRGLARLFATNGLHTVVYDPDQNALAAAQKLRIPKEAHQDHAGAADPGDKFLKYTTVLKEAVSEADFIIESAPEDLEIKRKLFSEIASIMKPGAIVASNTSTFPLAKLSDQQPFADRLIITHFFNPAHIIPLVEIVQTESTSSGVAVEIENLLRRCGKVPVILKKDIQGFIANRLQAAVLREACFLLEKGIADARQIDTVMKESIGMRWALSGPFQVADYGGLDIWEKVLRNLLPVLDNKTEVPLIISEKVKRNELGLKTGKGFFNYDVSSSQEHASDWTTKLMRLLKARMKGT
ncbi:MAG: 3-hydroxyacyl-CoA dehydrogenase NAD-binding domain-containing protein [Cyclobacteriaceae bacterium]